MAQGLMHISMVRAAERSRIKMNGLSKYNLQGLGGKDHLQYFNIGGQGKGQLASDRSRSSTTS